MADQPRHQHLEMDDPVGDPLLGHLDRGDIARLAQDGRGAVADLADHRDIVLLPEIGREGRRGAGRRSARADGRRRRRAG